jgi:hypothetical protein
MMNFQKSIPRRTFLRGVGTTLALPLLDSMVPAFASAATGAATSPLRLCYIYVPVGRIMDRWTPKTLGANFEFTPTLAPLAPFRDQLLVVSGLNIKAADPLPGEGGGNHARPSAAYLTGVHPKPGANLGISVDQVIAKETAKHTQIASLELGIDPPEFNGGDEGAYSGYYRSTISWRGATTPLPTEHNPRKVFERMFGDSDSTDPAARMRRILRQRSVLDSVLARVSRLSREVGAGDRAKLDEYLEAVRDVERRIQVAETTSASSEMPAMERPSGIPATYGEHATLMFDLQLLAFQTDLTRVITFMMGHEGTNRTYREVGARDGHHSLSHHKGQVEAIETVARIDLYQSKQFAYFLDKMRATRDGAGTLLDHSVVVYGSALSDGNAHYHNNVPILVAGNANGRVKGGRHVQYEGLPLSNLHMAILDMMSVSEQAYLSKDSDATGKLEGLGIAS